MTNLAEIQEAIEKLAPEERAALREWLDESDPDTMTVIRGRVRQIRAGEATLIDLAGEHDETGSFVAENLAELKAHRVFSLGVLFEPGERGAPI